MSCAVSRQERVGRRSLPKSMPMPSVARTRTSPRRTGTDSAPKEGGSSPTTPGRSRSERTCPPKGPPVISLPSTFPIPSQLISPLPASNAARLIAAPLDSRSSASQRSASATTSSLGYRSTTEAAFSAAAAAAGPCPRPSITAATALPGVKATTPRSPMLLSPSRALPAAPHSRARSASPRAVRREALELVTLPPLLHDHGRSLARGGLDVKVVHQTPGTRQAEPQTVLGAVALTHRGVDVGDPAAGVAGDDDHAPTVVVLSGSQHDLAISGVHDDVSRHLRDGGRDLGRVDAPESEPVGERARLRPGGDDVAVRCDHDLDLRGHGRRVPGSDGRAVRGPLQGRVPIEAARGSAGTAPSSSPLPAVSRRSPSRSLEGAPSTRSPAGTWRRTSR